MPEIKTPPVVGEDKNGDLTHTFTPQHSIADIVRWVVDGGFLADFLYILELDYGVRTAASPSATGTRGTDK